jgi:Mrp family chromosome partitioning ATPase
VIVLTAPNAAAGQGALAAGLARSIALAESKTLLVDADLRRADILQQLARRREGRDFADALCDGGDWRDVLLQTRNPSVSILAARKGHWSEPATRALSSRLKDLVADWKQEFDTIVINAPPALTFPEARVIASVADDVLLCVEWNRTDHRLVAEAVELLSEIGKKPKTVLIRVAGKSYRYLLGPAATYFAKPPQLRIVNA